MLAKFYIPHVCLWNCFMSRMELTAGTYFSAVWPELEFHWSFYMVKRALKWYHFNIIVVVFFVGLTLGIILMFHSWGVNMINPIFTNPIFKHPFLIHGKSYNNSFWGLKMITHFRNRIWKAFYGNIYFHLWIFPFSKWIERKKWLSGAGPL